MPQNLPCESSSSDYSLYFSKKQNSIAQHTFVSFLSLGKVQVLYGVFFAEKKCLQHRRPRRQCLSISFVRSISRQSSIQPDSGHQLSVTLWPLPLCGRLSIADLLRIDVLLVLFLCTRLVRRVVGAVERAAENSVLHCHCHSLGNAGEGHILWCLPIIELKWHLGAKYFLPGRTVLLLEEDIGSSAGDHSFMWIRNYQVSRTLHVVILCQLIFCAFDQTSFGTHTQQNRFCRMSLLYPRNFRGNASYLQGLFMWYV